MLLGMMGSAKCRKSKFCVIHFSAFVCLGLCQSDRCQRSFTANAAGSIHYTFIKEILNVLWRNLVSIFERDISIEDKVEYQISQQRYIIHCIRGNIFQTNIFPVKTEIASKIYF